MTKLTLISTLLGLFISNIGFADKPVGSIYIEGNNSSALILAHGKGKHPAWLVVDPLRKAVNAQLGYHTLSLQMPTGHEFWEDYTDDFPSAYSKINNAIRFLRKEKGVNKIYLMGHSMGSRMVSAYVSKHPQHSLSGLIIVGCRNNGERPLSCDENISQTILPILDVWGNTSGKDHDAAAERSHFVSKRYKQLSIKNANHRFDGYEKIFTSAVIRWLKRMP